MNEKLDEFGLRLESIETQWSLVRRAHHDTTRTDSSKVGAKEALVLRYSSAIRNFVRVIIRNENEVDEVSQDVVLRLLKGDFGGADPDRGRFRDLLKTAIRNMIKNTWSKKTRRKETGLHAETLHLGKSDAEVDDAWTNSWRDNILEIAWSQLKNYQMRNERNLSHSLLKLRADHPDWDLTKIAEKLSQVAGRTINTNTIRQQLRRARVRFAEFVVEEVAHGLDTPEPDRVHIELINLGLYSYVKDSLPAEWQNLHEDR